MTTATQNHATAAPARPDPTTPDVGLDTRLMLASIGLDVTLGHAVGSALAEANAAATAAILEAQNTEDPKVTFEPNAYLAEARAIIESRGWIKGEYGSTTGAVCAMSAIREAVYGPEWGCLPTDDRETGPVNELLARIADDTGTTAYSIPAWNDSRDSVDDVVKLLY